MLTAFALVLGLAAITPTTVSATPAQHLRSEHTSACSWGVYSSTSIFDQGTGVVIGAVTLWMDGCGHAEGECTAYAPGRINHCYLWYYNANGIGAGYETADVGGSSPVWTDIVSGFYTPGDQQGYLDAIGVVQDASHGYWGDNNTPGILV